MLKKLVSIIFILVTGIYLYSSELPEGFTEVKSSSTYKMVLTPYATYPVMIEEYMPKVIVEGKWGTGPGEFGSVLIDMEKGIMPRSISVDSKGNIYVLDTVNNRIQKFDNKGKYLLSIPVDSYKGKILYYEGKPIMNESKGMEKTYENDTTEALGINIAIDSEDNLYYYLERNNKGEVWQFKEDKLVKKHETKLGNSLIVKNNRLFLDMDKYYIDINTGKKYEEIPDEKSKYTLYLSSSESGLPKRIINIKSKTTNKVTKIDLSKAEYSIRYYGFLTQNEIYIGVGKGYASTYEVEIYIYDLEKKLIKKLEGVPPYYIDKYYFYYDEKNDVYKVIQYVPKDK